MYFCTLDNCMQNLWTTCRKGKRFRKTVYICTSKDYRGIIAKNTPQKVLKMGAFAKPSCMR